MNKKITIAVIIIILVAASGGAAYMLLPNADTKDDAAEKSNTNTTLYNASANKNTNKNSNKNSNKNTNVTKNDNANTVSDTDTTNTNSNTNANVNTAANANTNTTTAKNTNTAATTTTGTTYKNDRYGFSVKVPKLMEELSDKETVGYYPFGLTDSKDEADYEGQWFISVYSSKTQDELMTALKDSLKDGKVEKETIKIGDLSATKATVSGSNRSFPITAVYVEHNGRVFEIMDSGSADTDFTDFYNSFKF